MACVEGGVGGGDSPCPTQKDILPHTSYPFHPHTGLSYNRDRYNSNGYTCHIYATSGQECRCDKRSGSDHSNSFAMKFLFQEVQIQRFAIYRTTGVQVAT